MTNYQTRGIPSDDVPTEETYRSETLVLPASDQSALASYCNICGASAKQPCKVRRTGRLLSKPHEARRPLRVINRFVSADSNRLSPDAIAAEAAVHGHSPREALRFDPLDSQVIDESGAYVTFVGSAQAVEGAHSPIRSIVKVNGKKMRLCSQCTAQVPREPIKIKPGKPSRVVEWKGSEDDTRNS